MQKLKCFNLMEVVFTGVVGKDLWFLPILYAGVFLKRWCWVLPSIGGQRF
jgi:hypothetical protein